MDFEDQIAKVCIDEYLNLPINVSSKLNSDKYIILAGVVLSSLNSISQRELKCVALGTGTKCLSQNKISCEGDSLNDCHAEVIAKRCFQRYLWEQCQLSLENKSDLLDFIPDNLKSVNIKKPIFVLKNASVNFHLYISQAPCGDASTEALDKENPLKPFESESPPIKKNKTLKQHQSDSVKKGRENFSLKGTLRTKPGRLDSEPTLSLSCSDKIARWNALGIQGGILGTYFIAPIYLSSIIVGELFDKEALSRALILRLDSLEGLELPYFINCPDILSTKVPFIHGKYHLLNKIKKEHGNSALYPQENSVAWSLANKPEILISGRKQGAAKDRKTGKYSIKTRSRISRSSFLNSYNVLLSSKEIHTLINSAEFPLNMTYKELKNPTELRKSTPYQVSRKAFFSTSPFKNWLLTQNIIPSYNEFTT